MSTGKQLDIAFWPHTPERHIASTRIRCLQVLSALQQSGVKAGLYAQQGTPPKVLVLAKRYDLASLAHARQLQSQNGVKLVLDICDNHLYLADESPKLLQRREALEAALQQVDLVVAATPTLADRLIAHLPGIKAKVTVIGDAVDADSVSLAPVSFRTSTFVAWAKFRVWMVRQRIQPGRRLLWFGNHGSDGVEGGMQDIDLIAPDLAAHHAHAPLSLTVVSNSQDKYDRLSSKWRFASTYLPWSAGLTARLSAHHDIAIIPAGINPFTECKSPNRAVTSFLNGLAVVAAPVPSYTALFGDVIDNDWQAGLAHLMQDSAARAAKIAAAQTIIATQCNVQAIAKQWQDVLVQLQGH
jgi:hypothetical protein